MSFVDKKLNNGYIALVSMLIVASLSIALVITVSLRGIEELSMSFTSSQASDAFFGAEACIEDVLEGFRKEGIFSQDFSLAVGNGACDLDVSVLNGDGTARSIGGVGVHAKRINVSVDKNNAVLLWEEQTK